MAAFSSVIGQKSAKGRLNSLLNGKPAQSYVLTGPSGIGKTMLAREMAKTLLCMSPDKEGYCDSCKTCHYFEEKSHPDYIELECVSGDKNIPVAQVRDRVVADVRMFPQISNRKVYVIDGDSLNEDGQNALLKTMEEPPQSVVLILTVADSDKLLKTIVSRSVVISLQPNTESEVVQILKERLSLDSEDASFHAQFAAGNPGNAMKLAQSGWLKELREEVYNLVFSLPTVSNAELLISGYAFFSTNKEHMEEILMIIQMILGDMALLRADVSCALRGRDKRDKMIQMISSGYPTFEQIRNASDAITIAARALKSNCSFETAVCQMLLAIKKEFVHA